MRIDDPRPFDEAARTADLAQVLSRLWTYSVTTKSDEARIYADEIAEASSRGFITTAVAPHGTLFGRLWKLTPTGLSFLFDNAGCPQSVEKAYAENHSR